MRAFFELGGTAEALVKEICQERCTIENVDALWSEYCAQTLDEGAGAGEARAGEEAPRRRSARKPAGALQLGSIVVGARYCDGAGLGVGSSTTEGVEMKARGKLDRRRRKSRWSSIRRRTVRGRRGGSCRRRARGPPTTPAPKPSVKREPSRLLHHTIGRARRLEKSSSTAMGCGGS